MRLLGINSDSIRGQRLTQTGCKFSFTNVSTITLTPDGVDGSAQIITSGTFASAASTIKSITLTGSLTCNLSSSAGGGLDTGSKATDKGYYVFVITKDSTYDAPLLLASLSETAPTMPSGYTYRSDPVWFMATDDTGPAGDVREFLDVNGSCFYNKVITVLTDGVSTSWAAVDCSTVTPNNSRAWFKSLSRSKSTSVWNTISLHTNGSDAVGSTFRTLMHVNVIRNANGGPGSQQSWEHPMVDAATSLYYHWTTAPGSGGSYPPVFRIFCRGWTLL